MSETRNTKLAGNLVLNAFHDGTRENWCYEVTERGLLVDVSEFEYSSPEEALKAAEETNDERIPSKR